MWNSTVALERIWKWGEEGTSVQRKSGGHRSGVWRRKKNSVGPLHFLALKTQLVVLVSAFVMVSTVWSVSCLLFSTHGVPHAQTFVKVGRGHVPPVPHGVGAIEIEGFCVRKWNWFRGCFQLAIDIRKKKFFVNYDLSDNQLCQLCQKNCNDIVWYTVSEYAYFS